VVRFYIHFSGNDRISKNCFRTFSLSQQWKGSLIESKQIIILRINQKNPCKRLYMKVLIIAYNNN